MHHKALLIPINSNRELFIQDRRGYKPPDWGFFGGSIEAGETPQAAVIREAKEELCIDLKPCDLIYLGEFYIEYEREGVERHLFLYKTDEPSFDVREGRGGKWASAEEAGALLHTAEYFKELWSAIEVIVT